MLKFFVKKFSNICCLSKSAGLFQSMFFSSWFHIRRDQFRLFAQHSTASNHCHIYDACNVILGHYLDRSLPYMMALQLYRTPKGLHMVSSRESIQKTGYLRKSWEESVRFHLMELDDIKEACLEIVSLIFRRINSQTSFNQIVVKLS